jgi:hypothetical protein
MSGVIEFMADLDRQIADQLSALQARGADKTLIEARYAELCEWAIVQCTEQGKLHPPHDSEEVATLIRLWDSVAGQVAEAKAHGTIKNVHCYSITRCEDGDYIILTADSDDDQNAFAGIAGEDWPLHFDRAVWWNALGTLVDGLATIEVLDLCQLSEANPDWTLMVYGCAE